MLNVNKIGVRTNLATGHVTYFPIGKESHVTRRQLGSDAYFVYIWHKHVDNV